MSLCSYPHVALEQVRAEEEAMEVDEVVREGEEGDGENKEGDDEGHDLPDDLNLDDGQEVSHLAFGIS